MKCPVCNEKSKPSETRTRGDGIVRRRYECPQQHKFTTLEAIVDDSETQLHPKQKTIKTRGRAGLSAMWFSNNGSSGT